MRAYKQLEVLQNAIKQAQKQLVVLNTFTAQKEQAITTLMNIHNMGVKESEIVELMNFVGKSCFYFLCTKLF
jgi:hypothetical protein